MLTSASSGNRQAMQLETCILLNTFIYHIFSHYTLYSACSSFLAMQNANCSVQTYILITVLFYLEYLVFMSNKTTQYIPLNKKNIMRLDSCFFCLMYTVTIQPQSRFPLSDCTYLKSSRLTEKIHFFLQAFFEAICRWRGVCASPQSVHLTTCTRWSRLSTGNASPLFPLHHFCHVQFIDGKI